MSTENNHNDLDCSSNLNQDKHDSDQPILVTEETENIESIDKNNEESDELALLKKENIELEDLLLRSKAELDNIQKRTVKQIHQAQLYSVEKFSSELLIVMDSLEAVEKLSYDSSIEIQTLIEGNKMLLKTIKEVFEKLSIEEISPLNQVFDPEYHQAMATKESDDFDNQVLEVMQKGYKLKSRLLRPAIVVVGKKVK